MPHRQISGPRHKLEMAECQVTHYPNQEKICKYHYAPWGSTCEIHFPRRRSRSETNDPCRRRVKEMKTLTPKKYRTQEYENMDYDYEARAQWSEKYDCCRIRANLCELPTTYISNNCQSNVTKASADSGDYMECLKSVTYDNTVKFVGSDEQLENLEKAGSMEHYTRLSPNKFDYSKCQKKPDIRSPGKNITLHSRSMIRGFMPLQDNHPPGFKSQSMKNLEINTSSCREYCPLVDFKLHNLSDHRPVCYDTGTYFDKRIDHENLKERYNVELEFLRERLKKLRDSAYGIVNAEKLTVETAPNGIKNNNAKEIKITALEVEMKVNKKEKIKVISPPVSRHSKNRLVVRTKGKVNHVKLKKIPKPKIPTSASTSSKCAESDFSGSDTEHEVNSDELDNVSEKSLEGSNRESSEVSSSLGPQESGSGDSATWPIRPSLFPNIPPYIHFNTHDSKEEYTIPGKRHFKWKLTTITPVIIRKTITNSGFALVRSEFTRESNQWLGTWGKHMKSPMFKTLKDSQKLNHFPGTFQLGRKDRLWRNFQKMIAKYGHKEFGFLPLTYVLPQDLRLLKQSWEFRSSCGELWIIKPPASARGVGIKVINKWSQLPKKTSLVVQKYIANPYLINGSKFDLRLYVLVTSFDPLRIYLYPEGLARFACAKYSDDAKDLKDRYMHLTNYSINKLSSQYTANEDANACQGHKWTLSKFMEYMQGIGVDTKALWKNFQSLVVKTMIACEAPIVKLCEENMSNRYNCYELFGVDVLLDDNLKPWLLEVNISPSLHSASPLDAHVKGPMVQTLFNMAQFHLPQRLAMQCRNCPPCYEPKLYSTNLTKKERSKHTKYAQMGNREDYLEAMLKDITGDDVRQLTRAEDEFVVKGRFEKIFPTSQSFKYLNFMEPRYYNRLFDAWETKYENNRKEGIALLQSLCAKKVHLKVASPNPFSESGQNMKHSEASIQPSTEGQSYPLEEILRQASITNEVPH
ncbi:unnamed protein product [Acanthoscelides obtectus]|uniref:Tubulin polyglutamylase TTLL4 n=2 Tax=Acanthoscelides obtectus TaxID=200917 RepID=A0A9P0Q7X4_ACAOB|nr:unnamed protein product [Acanthoscelides obtectus]CAK1634146.1 Tubulin polyglutamylase TTLL4 [Acanthoscelides obtectus]